MPSSPSSDHQAQAGVSEPSTPQAQSVTAVVGLPSLDTREAPPLMPTMYICRYWDWVQYGIEKPRWVPRTSQFPHYDNPPYWTGMGKVEQEAAELVNKGCRNVRIVTIPSSQPPSPEAKPCICNPGESGMDHHKRCPAHEPQSVEAGWRRALEMIGDERRTTGATIDGLRSIAREALSKAPQPPDIQPESSQQPPSSKQEDDREWVKLHELREGAIFETKDGVLAVKSEYCYDNNGACKCILLESGEYAHFCKDTGISDTAIACRHNDTLVREITPHLPQSQSQPPSPEPQPVEAGWRSRCRIFKAIARPGWYIVINEHGEAGPRLRWCKSGRWHADDMDIYWDSEEEARAALSKAPQPPDIQPESSQQPPSSKQEDDREWEKRCKFEAFGDSEYGYIVSPSGQYDLCYGVDRPAHWYGPKKASDRGGHYKTSAVAAMLAKAPPPPDSKPPTQSEEKESCGTFAVDRWLNDKPTKPTESVQPWPEDLSVLVGRTITTRHRPNGESTDGPGMAAKVISRHGGSLSVHVPGDVRTRLWTVYNRDLLSVSPPLEAKPQSGQSEGKVPTGATLTIRVYQEDGYWVARCEELDVLTADPSRETAEADIRRVCEAQIMFGIKSRTVSRVLNYKFFPDSNPKDSKEMGELKRYSLNVSQRGASMDADKYGKWVSVESAKRVICQLHQDKQRLEAALKSANERAEAAEKELATLKGAKRD